jgi:hypothetical protein
MFIGRLIPPRRYHPVSKKTSPVGAAFKVMAKVSGSQIKSNNFA